MGCAPGVLGRRVIGRGINVLMRGEKCFGSKRVLFNACYVKGDLEVKERWPSTDVYQRDSYFRTHNRLISS